MEIEIIRKIPVTDKMTSNLLCNAFEGGSNYWIDSVSYYFKGKHVSPAQARKLVKDLNIFDSSMVTKDIEDHIFDSSMVTKDIEDPAYLWLPLIEGGEVRVTVADEGDEFSGKVFVLDMEHIKHGMVIMANDHAKHFDDFINENDDAITGDVLLQCCLFGKLIFG
jgi:hypothetical protein